MKLSDLPDPEFSAFRTAFRTWATKHGKDAEVEWKYLFRQLRDTDEFGDRPNIETARAVVRLFIHFLTGR